MKKYNSDIVNIILTISYDNNEITRNWLDEIYINF